MRLPSRTAATIVVKQSSAITMSATLLVTSVPLMPMATPMSADFMDGASFTPSPVMATTSPAFFLILTIRFLCAGVTLANTLPRRIASARSLFVMASSCSPEYTSEGSEHIPACFATASAVRAWSPVIITVAMPARRHSATASFTPLLSPSASPARPRNIMSLSPSPRLYAKASTRIASSEKVALRARTAALSPSVMGRKPPFVAVYVQSFIRISGAPLA